MTSFVATPLSIPSTAHFRRKWEAIEAELASETFLRELIALSPIHAIDDFFALGGLGMQGVRQQMTA